MGAVKRIAEDVIADVWTQSGGVLSALNLDHRWLTGKCSDWSTRMTRDQDAFADCNPLLGRLLSDRVLHDGAFGASLVELYRYTTALGQLGARALRRLRNDLASDDPAKFQNALAEMAVHQCIASIGAPITFVRSGGKPTPDYEITIGGKGIRAELKSITSPEVRLRGSGAVELFSASLDELTAKLIAEHYEAPFVKRQLSRREPGLVFVDVSMCDYARVAVVVNERIGPGTLRDNLHAPLSALCRADDPGQFARTPLWLVFLDTILAHVALVVPVEVPANWTTA